MSVLFPKTNKPRQWDYRPIYFDAEKDKRKQRLDEMKKERERNENVPTEDGEFKTSIERGTFREMAERNRSVRTKETRMMNFRVLIIVVLLLLLFCWIM